jgi:hypothetical protein
MYFIDTYFEFLLVDWYFEVDKAEYIKEEQLKVEWILTDFVDVWVFLEKFQKLIFGVCYLELDQSEFFIFFAI